MQDRPQPPIVRPINWVMWISVITSILGGFTVLSIAWPYVVPIIQNRNLWAAISLILILLFTSGHMFNHIRKVPYVAGDGRGGVSYFAGGFSNQFGLETQIVAAICESYTLWKLIPRLTMDRWSPLFRYYITGPESSTHIGPKDATSYCHYLGRSYLLHV